MISKGPSALSDGELLSVLLRSGTKDRNALELSRDILSSCGGRLSALFSMSPQQLCSFPGIKMYKAAAMLSAFELGRRFISEASSIVRKPIITPRNVFEIMLPHFKGLDREELWGLFLNKSNYLVSREMLSSGSIDSTPMDCSAVVKRALELRSTGIIITHNHPGANPEASRADMEQTSLLRKAASTFGISLIDHVIVCDDCFYSFADDSVYNA